MKQKILSAVFAICMALILIPVKTEAADSTNTEFLAAAKDGVITLTEDVTLTDELDVEDGNALIIDLAGKTLQLTKAGNYITNNSNVTIKNGTVNIDNVIATGDCIIGVGNYSTNGTLTFSNVTITGTNYSSAYAVIYVYGESTLNIKDESIVNLTNDASSAGGAIKTEEKTKGIVNIVESTLNFTDTVRGIVDGTVTIDNSTITMTSSGTGAGLDNGINSTADGLNLIIKNNSTVDITGYTGRGLTVDGGSTITVTDSAVTTQGTENSEGGIMFKATATEDAAVTFEGESSLTADTIVVVGTKANVEMSNDTTLKVDEIDVPEEVEVEDIVTLPVNYGVNEDGKIEELAKIVEVNGKQYATIQAAVDAAGTTASTITLLGDAAGNGFKVRAGQNIVFDFAGYTYTINGELVGSTGTETLCAQLLKDSNVTFKNGTLTTSNEEAAILVQNYSDLTLIDMNLVGIATTQYVLSNNFGDILATGNTNITAIEGNVAFDIWYGMSSAYAEGVKVTFDENYTGAVTGIIEYGTADTTVTNWEEKAALRIKNGNFQKATLKASNSNSLETANVKIYGGTFDTDFVHIALKEFCAENFAPQKNADGTYSVHLHTLTAVAGKEATCTEEGNVAYWYCATCGVHYSDAAGTKEISADSVKLPALGHDEVSHGNYDATCTASGREDGTKCARCGLIMTEPVKVPALGHSSVNGICTTCGISEKTSITSSPATGDSSNGGAWAAVVALTCACMASMVFAGKKKYNK